MSDRLTDILGGEWKREPDSPLFHIEKPFSPVKEPLPADLIHDPLEPKEPLEKQIARRMEIYFDNPWAMITDEYIWTLDEADKVRPTKLMPPHKWLEAITWEWMNEDLLAIFKSRRMMISWLFIFLHLWLVLFREGRSVFFVSDKEEKSDELIDRVEFIYNHIPDTAFLKPRIKRTYCHFEVPGLDSYILGVAQGARQLAQFTASALFFDEFAHWERARETFMAAKPTIDGGGKVTLVSSPREGFFKEICFDEVK